MSFPKQTELQGQTPEELTRALDIQIAMLRNQRAAKSQLSPTNRAVTLVSAILLMIVVGGAAIAYFQNKGQDLVREHAAAAAPRH